MEDHEASFQRLVSELDKTRSGCSKFRPLFSELRALADAGFLDACGLLAELQAVEPDVYDPAEAYKWYYIALKREGFSVEYRNEYGSPESYLGPIGDFRNEPMVSDLIQTLGVPNIRALDRAAEEWLATHAAPTSEAGPDRHVP